MPFLCLINRILPAFCMKPRRNFSASFVLPVFPKRAAINAMTYNDESSIENIGLLKTALNLQTSHYQNHTK